MSFCTKSMMFLAIDIALRTPGQMQLSHQQEHDPVSALTIVYNLSSLGVHHNQPVEVSLDDLLLSVFPHLVGFNDHTEVSSSTSIL